ncbi:SMP-30/gluconolactonase/LRE family protein [Sphingosinicella rhizophila]|uniref:SMP-30/gluconolactonase/LRE family protein n=1 Tax=Sphingosinicella rhizophila TaxID=3050082 RepID=A0ABU3Q5Q1_9SPHN|nr:SMP-30/gluconolactonase/LRE family protein [Sphingosinicella sp. GR2756]MDT9598399.1 SMP-30/gluconolactonase/LRE family protein [Sphingosinicella sp. GR2756]
MTDASEATCLVDCKALLGEGPVWVERERALYWVDIKGRMLFRYDWESGSHSSWPTPFRVGSIAPRRSGGFVAGTDQGIAAVDPARNLYEIIADPEPDRPTNRFNDGKVDRNGRFWAGTMDDREELAQGALYRFDPDLSWRRLDDGYRVTNGPAFSPDGHSMYHNDSARRIIYAFDLDEQGNPSERRIFAQFGEDGGSPDGMTVDAEGCLWVAFWDGWCVRRFSPSGACIGELSVPVQRPTSCAFGGPGLDHLFITSARTGLDAQALAGQPQAGGLFMVRPGHRGVAEILFAG